MVAIGANRIDRDCSLRVVVMMVLAVAVVMAMTVAKPRNMHMRAFIMLGCDATRMRMGNRRQLIGDETDEQQE
jgi:hypothetical protein